VERPRYIENFLQEGEQIFHVSKWRGVEEWASDHFETVYEQGGSKTYPIHREGTTFKAETLIFTSSRVFFFQYSFFLGRLKRWTWFSYAGIDSLTIKPVRLRNGMITGYLLEIEGGNQSRQLYDSKDRLEILDRIFQKFAKKRFSWRI